MENKTWYKSGEREGSDESITTPMFKEMITQQKVKKMKQQKKLLAIKLYSLKLIVLYAEVDIWEENKSETIDLSSYKIWIYESS